MKDFKSFLLESIMTRDEAMKVLEMSPDQLGDTDALKSAYRVASRKNHPDLGGSEDAMKRVNAAYEMLKNMKKGPTGRDFEADKEKHLGLAKAILKDMEKKYDASVFVRYFEEVIGKKFTVKTESGANTNYWHGSAVISSVFTSDDGKTIINLRYNVSTQGTDFSKNVLGFADLTLNTFVYTDVLHDRRKHKMKQRDREFSRDGKIFTDPKILFPKAKLQKMVSNEKRALKKRDFELTLKSELGATTSQKDTWKIPAGGDYYFIVTRMTMMRVGTWSINGLYKKYSYVAGTEGNATFMEDQETLDRFVDTFKPLRSETNERRLKDAMNKLVDDYKREVMKR